MLLLALLLGLCPPARASAAAVPAAAASSGYVVRVDSGVVYLDLGSASGARIGQEFRVYTLGPTLIDPATGRNLGRPKSFVADGRITDVEPLYSEGALISPSAPAAAGMRAELGALPAAEPAAPAKVPEASAAPQGRKPRWRSPWFDFPAAAFAVGNFSGAGKPEVALASRKTVRLYPYPPESTATLAQFAVPGIGSRIVSLTADASSAAPARLLATFYDDGLGRMETDVLTVSSGAWTLEQNIPWMVRAYRRADGARALAAQQLLDDATFPFSAIYPLEAGPDGRYAPGDKALAKTGSDWLYGFARVRLDSAPAEIFVTDSHRIKAVAPDGTWESDEAYGRTPVRLSWQNKILEFYPPMPVLEGRGGASLFLVRNESRFGAMAEAFGIFDGAEIVREDWSGGAFSPAWTSKTPGFVTDLALEGSADAPTDLAAVVSTRAGKSSLWIYDP
ncbi:MAG: hypothetical protein KGL04_03385 [Elusimicrobia bacterium]|nr:hypothetical protein [Elusimicrobiota bacterium]MDE2313200.1 hypothetical protein [Elusimicrobiota bacterium]